MDSRQPTRILAAIPLLVIALLTAGCETGDRAGPGPGPPSEQITSAAPEGHKAADPPGGTTASPQSGDEIPGLPPDPERVAQRLPDPDAGSVPGEILLSRSRYYRLDVETVDKSILVTVSRRWLYKDGFPEGLIAAIRKQPDLKETDRRLFDSRDGKVAASRYIRWEPSKTGKKAAALLLYVDGTDADGEPRHELAISVDLELDAMLGKAQPQQTVVFDEMAVDLDLTNARLAAVRWSGKPLQDGDAQGEGPEHTVDIRVTGTLTAESSANIRGADALLADDVTNAFRSLAAISFQNESHHGITLGWLGLDHLRHGLIVVPRQDGKIYDLQYSVAGESFDLEAMRRQLEAASWPIVLRGRDYVGTSLSGQHVFQPVECLVSRRMPEQPATKPATKPAKKAAAKPAKKAAAKP